MSDMKCPNFKDSGVTSFIESFDQLEWFDWHPEYDLEPDWRIFTKAEYLALHSLGNQEWAEMMQEGAIRKRVY